MGRKIDTRQLADQLEAIIKRAAELEAEYSAELAAVHAEFRESAKNLVHYLALRQFDISTLQEDLAALGLSSLGRAERNVMASVRAVMLALQRISSDASNLSAMQRDAMRLRNPQADAHKKAILGEHPTGRDVSIMVTLPTEAAQNPVFVRDLVAAGMNVARINCAHDNAAAWEAMVANVRAAGAEAGKECRVIMDLAGPKLRTGELRAGPRVLHIRPRRDPLGQVVTGRRIRLIPDDVPRRGTKAAVLPVPRQCVVSAYEGDEFRFVDTRGKGRRLTVVRKDDKGLVVETRQGAYIATGTQLQLVRETADEEAVFSVGELPPIEQPILLRTGDTLVLHKESIPGAPAREDADGNVTRPAHISCQQPEVFGFVVTGDSISLNDGKIMGVVRTVDTDRLEVEITKAKPTGSRLRGNRGINFPNSDIRLPGLTATDMTNLGFVLQHADAVGLSFVRTPSDVVALQEALKKDGARPPGIVIKIETKQAFRNLPRLLLTAMRSYPAAVMIARGDLAVECGWERLAELQEEILWFCEAAHMPVMWGTQVLEQKAKKGQPSRAEISDAAMSQRADCVMLNKGPHILAAIRMLDNILRRMQGHQFKKTARMRKLKLREYCT